MLHTPMHASSGQLLQPHLPGSLQYLVKSTAECTLRAADCLQVHHMAQLARGLEGYSEHDVPAQATW